MRGFKGAEGLRHPLERYYISKARHFGHGGVLHRQILLTCRKNKFYDFTHILSANSS